jgi:hypothetical protein
MLDILRKQFETGYANRSDLAAQEAALAQNSGMICIARCWRGSQRAPI